MIRLTYHVLSIILIIGIALTFDACKKEEDKPSGNDEPIIPETTKVIEKEVWNENFISVDTSNFQFIFKDDINSTLDIKPGDIIVSQEGYGYLRKVTKVDEDGNNIKVYTSFASLTDAIEKGRFSFREVLSEQKIKEINYLKEGVVLSTSDIKGTENTDLHYDLDTYIDDDEKVHLTGEFDLLPEVLCDYEISGWTVKILQIEFKVEEEISLTADIDLLDISFNEEVLLGKVTFAPIIVLIGVPPAAVPVVVVPELEIKAGAILEVHSNVITDIHQEFNYTAGILYENQQWTVYDTVDKEFNFTPPILSATAEAKAYIAPQLNLKIYGLVAPYLKGELYCRVDADINVSPWWSLYGGTEIGVGVEVEILGAEIFDYYTDPPLIEYEELVAEAESGNDETFTDPRDGQEYNIVTIGDQTWFAENLNYETGNSWCYDDDPTNCDIYGRSYDWETIMNGAESSNEVPSGVQGICPDGWHFPSDNEWKILEGTVDSQYPVGDPEWEGDNWEGFDVGKKLKSIYGWYENGNGTDDFHFNSLPGGYRIEDDNFTGIDKVSSYWTSTEKIWFTNDSTYRSNTAYHRNQHYYSDQTVRGGGYGKELGFSVRCLKD